MAGSKRLSWVLAGACAGAVALFGWTLFHKKPSPQTRQPVTAIAVAKVQMRDVLISINALGQAQGWQAVTVRPQVNGKLLRVPVREGSEVAAGALVAEIDPAPFRAALMQTQGALARDQAQLKLGKLKLSLYRQLATQDSIASLDVETQAALVSQLEGDVMLDQGALAAAQVNLDYTRILAPVAGRIGVRLVDAGNLVSTTDTGGIVTINQISPIAVTFNLPQGEFQRLSQFSNGFEKPLVTQAFSQESGELLDSGELVVIDNRVDPTTATVQLKARFANTRRHLWPGQLLNVKLTLETVHDAVVLPSIAVNQGPNGPFTYVVENNLAMLRPLEFDLQQDDITIVKSGVKSGDTVVVEGQGSLRPGAKVAVRGAPNPATVGPSSESRPHA
jgi:membrane fusion protein, multidrug efflux system